MRIFINPGHTPQSDIDAGRDWDCGATGYGLQENIVAANIANLTAKYLSVLDCHIKIFQSMSLEEIADVSNYWDSDIFVSIHCNALDGTAIGSQSFYFYNSSAGELLAKSIQKNFNFTINRGISEAGFYVLKYTKCPAVLVETAFIDNPRDNDLLKFHQDDFAKSIARGITDFFMF